MKKKRKKVWSKILFLIYSLIVPALIFEQIIFRLFVSNISDDIIVTQSQLMENAVIETLTTVRCF